MSFGFQVLTTLVFQLKLLLKKKLQREQSKSRHDLGRVEFLNQVWKWKEQYGGRIVEQLRASGSMMDWSKSVFTMDARLSGAVNEAFVKLYKDGLIYRAKRMVNWCPMLRTALADMEVDTQSISKKTFVAVPSLGGKKFEFGVLHKFYYPLEHGEGMIPVATTRIETMLGDTAVAVHPDDERYKVWFLKKKVVKFFFDTFF